MKTNLNILVAASAIAILGSGVTLLAIGCPFKNKGVVNNQTTQTPQTLQTSQVNQPLKTAKALSGSVLLGSAAVGGIFAVKRWQNQRQQAKQQAATYQELEFPTSLPTDSLAKNEELVNSSNVQK